MNKVFTSPLAIIKVNGIAVGKMRNIKITENIRRGRVVGIGSLTPDELPPLDWSGMLNCAFYTIDFRYLLNNDTSPLNSAVVRANVSTVEQFVDTVLMQENGVQIDIMRKVQGVADVTTGVKTTVTQLFASIKGCFLTREGFDINEGQISGRDADFEYTTPILYPA